MEILNVVSGHMEQVLFLSGASELVTSGNQSAVINANRKEIVLISAISDCYIKFGVDPTASASDSLFLKEGTVFPFGVFAGHKVSVFGGNITIAK